MGELELILDLPHTRRQLRAAVNVTWLHCHSKGGVISKHYGLDIVKV